MWGYVRHRHIYQAGLLKDAGYSTRQAAIEKEEREREEHRRKQELIQKEKNSHAQNVKNIKANNRRDQTEQNLSSTKKKESAEIARNQIRGLNADHANALHRIDTSR